MSDNTWITPSQAAKKLGVTKDTLRRWAVAGRLAHLKLASGHRRYRASDIDKEVQKRLFDSKLTD